MGCVGLLAAEAALASRDRPRLPKSMLAGLAAGVMLFLLLGSSSSPQTDLVAHAGGFVTGVLLGLLLKLSPRVIRNPAVNLIAGAVFTLLVILTWRLALGPAR
jgi:membrane associated rhomboid family serine protease